MRSDETGTLVLVADATARIGAGHAMRLGTLGAAWKRAGGSVRAVGRVEIGFVRDRYAALGIEIGDADPVAGDVLVVDSYDAAVRFRWSQLPAPALRILVDDGIGGDIPPGFGVVWSPNAYASAASYRGYAGVVLAGTEYLAIRGDIPRWIQPRNGEILVSLGGGRPSRVLVEAMSILDELAGAERFAATGDWAPAGWRRVAPEDLWSAAVSARQLVTAAGSTVWEAASMGIPVVLLMTADNQRQVYRWCRDAGVPGLNALLVDAEFLAHQLRALLAVPSALPPVTDGSDRVVSRLRELVALRRAS